MPKGRYWAQPVLHRYDTYKLSNSRRVKLPAPRGAGQNWRLGPGNLVGTRRQVDFDPAGRTTIPLALNQLNPPVAKPKDTESHPRTGRCDCGTAGGHSSGPRDDNAIYQLAHALTRIESTRFPVQLNSVTRAMVARVAAERGGALAIVRRYPDGSNIQLARTNQRFRLPHPARPTGRSIRLS